MTTLTIKTTTGFNINHDFALANPKTTTDKPRIWIETDTVTGDSHRWFGTITGGIEQSFTVIDAVGKIQSLVHGL